MQPEKHLRALFDTHADSLFRHCYLRVLDRQQGKLLMERTFKRVWMYLRDDRTVTNLETLLYRVAHGLIQEHRKAIRLEPQHSQMPNDNNSALLQALEQMSEDDRDTLVMHFVDQLSVEQTANVLRQPKALVSKQLETAAERLEVLMHQ